jgi:hypothetical protein
MHKFGVFTALALSWITASCAERMANSAVIPEPTSPKAASKPVPNDVKMRRRAETVAESTRRGSAVRSHEVTPSASVRPKPSPEPQAPLPQVSPRPMEPPIWREPPAAAALPPPPEPAEPNFPVATLMPPPPEPDGQTYSSTPRTIELPPPPEPPISTLREVTAEATMPSPPDPAEPSFPMTTLKPTEPAQPSLSLHSQEQIATESPLPFPDLPSYLSLRPRFDWVDTVSAITLPYNLLPEAVEPSPVEGAPSLIRNPWPPPLDGT